MAAVVAWAEKLEPLWGKIAEQPLPRGYWGSLAEETKGPGVGIGDEQERGLRCSAEGAGKRGAEYSEWGAVGAGVLPAELGALLVLSTPVPLHSPLFQKKPTKNGKTSTFTIMVRMYTCTIQTTIGGTPSCICSPITSVLVRGQWP